MSQVACYLKEMFECRWTRSQIYSVMIYKAGILCSGIHRLCLPLIQVKDSLDFKFLKAILSSEAEKDLETTLEP